MPIPSTKIYTLEKVILNFIENYQYNTHISTDFEITSANLSANLNKNDYYGVVVENVSFKTNYPIIITVSNEKIGYYDANNNFISVPYDVKNTIEVWYDDKIGNPDLNITFYRWNSTGYESYDINITGKLIEHNVDLSRVKKITWKTHDGAQYYKILPGNIYELTDIPRHFDLGSSVSYYIESDAFFNISPSTFSFDSARHTDNIDISSNITTPWYITNIPSWVQFIYSTGTNLSIPFSINKNLEGERSTIITITRGGIVKNINITQEATSGEV